MKYENKIMDHIGEGSCGRIFQLPGSHIVRKINKNYKKLMPVYLQYKIHQISWDILSPVNGFKLLKTPLPFYNEETNEYSMELIDCNKYVCEKKLMNNIHLLNELRLYYKKILFENYLPIDFEIYKQSDGTYRLIDFDKFGFRSDNPEDWCFTWRT